ncbi:MAG: tRNA lysidine(34) synthetase TilS [Treponema sp.]|uniref:tRNA lysidine(34) synthetase TilS n=1 Tax=Treponema sp. TaxID=166 RepID=UPI0025FD80AC|nr:tRNA lysidine(34) synthetase TilS [Treponema sp.]MBQ8680922.1 tRNA lysidine(34) synthetase TilS [Treponema sp.]
MLADTGRLLLSQFEKKVLSGFALCGISAASLSENAPLGLAVSGGADSLSLLLAAHSLFGPSLLRVITLDHGIRPEEESGGDALFVKKLCEKLGIFCFVERFEYGKIEKDAEANGLSLEAHARNLRYRSFESFIQKEGLCALALAHNQNDQTETLLMRFLQGSSLEGMGGIRRKRGKIIRPLLDIPRSEIESYLTEKKQAWRTDATNSDTSYLRNKIRNMLVPLLNQQFSGWEKAVLAGGKKALADDDFFNGETLRLTAGIKEPKISRSFFFSLPKALKRRVFFYLLNKAGFGSRFPFALFEEVLSWENEKTRKISFENVQIILDSDSLFFSVGSDGAGQKTSSDSCLESGFSFLFRKYGDSTEFKNFLIRVEKAGDQEKVRLVIKKKDEKSPEKTISLFLSLPFILRSQLPGDSVRTADGKSKNLSELFTDWKIPQSLRNKVFVVEEFSPSLGKTSLIRAVLASFSGAKNWIVEEAKL